MPGPRGLFAKSASERYFPVRKPAASEKYVMTPMLVANAQAPAAGPRMRCALVQVVARLQRLVAWVEVQLARVQRLGQPLRRQVGRADRRHLALFDQPRVGLERLLQRRLVVVPVRLVEIDALDLQPGAANRSTARMM